MSERALGVPVLAKLAAAAQVGDDVDSTAVEPKPGTGAQEFGGQADGVAAVTGEQHGVFTAERVPLRRTMLRNGRAVLEVANLRTTFGIGIGDGLV